MRRVGRRRLVPLRQPFAPPRGAPLVEEDPPADPHDPGGIAALSPVVAGALPGADEGLLRQIVGIAARDPRQNGAQPPLVPHPPELDGAATGRPPYRDSDC